jgi:Glycosyltransferase WbsX
LRLPETHIAQAQLAAEYGVDSFGIYHYWSLGARLLSRPAEIHASLDLPVEFSLVWANHSWTRKWNGESGNVLWEQSYSEEDTQQHASYLQDLFNHPRYLKVDSRPVITIYDPVKGSSLIAYFRKNSIPCYAIAVVNKPGLNFEASLYDASVVLEPNCFLASEGLNRLDGAAKKFIRTIEAPGLYEFARKVRGLWTGTSTDDAYARMVDSSTDRVSSHMEATDRLQSGHLVNLRSVTPGFDNRPRYASGASVLRGSSPEAFGRFCNQTIEEAAANEHPLMFINAWNEWGEGMVLEPSLQHRRGYLEELKKALDQTSLRLNEAVT